MWLCVQIYEGDAYDSGDVSVHNQVRYNIKAFDEFFGRAGLGRMPDSITWMCCAQFAVTKQAIMQRSRTFYIQAHHYMRFNTFLPGTSLPVGHLVGKSLSLNLSVILDFNTQKRTLTVNMSE